MDYRHAAERRFRRRSVVARGVGVSGVGGRTMLGLRPGEVVQILGWDEDCDADVRAGVEATGGEPPVDDQFEGAVDAVVLWWRNGDGDLVDGLIDSIAMLGNGGVLWLLTPKPGRDGHVEIEDISDAAPTAGLRPTASISVALDWHGTRLVPRL